MKMSDVPKRALNARATPIPTKVVHDWDSLYQVLLMKGYVIIETDKVRITSVGGEEAVLVKMFNSYVRSVRKQPLYTKRIGTTRWYCTL